MAQIKQIIIILALLAYSAASATIPSWELPLDEGNVPWEDIPHEPDCDYSFEEDGLYYWIKDYAPDEVIVVNAHKFFARDYCYNQLAGMSHFGAFYNDYSDEEIVIPEEVENEGKTYKVTAIGFCAFGGCKNLRKVIIPNTVTELKQGAFYGCHNLTDVSLPPSVKSLPIGCFQNCLSLKTIDLTYIEDYLDIFDIFTVSEGYGDKGYMPDPEPQVLENVVLPLNPKSLNGRWFRSIRNMWCRNPEPPNIDFFFEPETLVFGTLYVPQGSKWLYDISHWTQIRTIVEETSGVEAPEREESAFALSGNALTANAGAVSVYRIDGTLVTTLAEGETATLPAGLYIVSDAAGRTHKISVR